MKNDVTIEAKVGAFVLVGLLLLAYMSLRVGESMFKGKEGYLIRARFDNVVGLVKGAPVKISGVDVGTVEGAQLENGAAVVTMRVNPAVNIPRDSVISVRTQGVVGDKYIDVRMGRNHGDYLKNGEEVPNVESAADLEALIKNISSIAGDVGAVTSSLNEAFAENDGAKNIGSIVSNMASLIRRFDTIVARNEGKIDDTIGQLREASAEMKKTFAALNDVADDIQKGKGMLGKIVKDPEMADKLNGTITSLNDVAKKLNDNKGTIGKLINDENMGRNLEKTMVGLNRYVEKADRLKMSLNYRGEFLTDTSTFKNYLDVRIQPQVDYFYQLGVVVDPRGRLTQRDIYANGNLTRVEEWDKNGLLFNAIIGKRFHDVVLRCGIIESSGGLGIDYLVLNDDLKLSFEAFDFSNSHRAHLKAYAEYKLFKNFYLSAGYDDFVSKDKNQSLFGGFALRFDDDDIKTVIGSW